MRGRDTGDGGDDGREHGPPPSFGHEPRHASEHPTDSPARSAEAGERPRTDDPSRRPFPGREDDDPRSGDFHRPYAPPSDPATGRPDERPRQQMEGPDADDEAGDPWRSHLTAVPPDPAEAVAYPPAGHGGHSRPQPAQGEAAPTRAIFPPAGEAPAGGPSGEQPLPHFGPPLPPPPPSQAAHAGGPPPPRARRRRTLLAAVAGVVAIVVLGVGGGLVGYAYTHRDQQQPPPQSGTAQHASSSSPNVSATPNPARIRSVAADPKPLTLREAFPASAPVVDGHRYHRVRELLNSRCAKAAQNSFGKVLKRAGCLRVLRATYVDEQKECAVTIGVAVLPTEHKAQQVVHRADPSHYVWFRPLPGPKASGSARIGRSGGYAAIVPVGHYVAFSFAAHTRGRPPKPDDRRLNHRSDAMRTYVLQPLLTRAMPT